VEAIEGNRRSKDPGQTGNHFAKTWRLRDKTRNRRQHVNRISLKHLYDRSVSADQPERSDPPV
jgi:hypothetical protein